MRRWPFVSPTLYQREWQEHFFGSINAGEIAFVYLHPTFVPCILSEDAFGCTCLAFYEYPFFTFSRFYLPCLNREKIEVVSQISLLRIFQLDRGGEILTFDSLFSGVSCNYLSISFLTLLLGLLHIPHYGRCKY